MVQLHAIYPRTGAREMVSLLFHEHGMLVARYVVVSSTGVYLWLNSLPIEESSKNTSIHMNQSLCMNARPTDSTAINFGLPELMIYDPSISMINGSDLA